MSEPNVTALEGGFCAKTHEWVLENDNQYTIGITAYGIEQLSEIVSVELPEVGQEFVKNEVFATLESVKAATELFMPIGGTVVEINSALMSSPEILNEDSYQDGWLIKVESDTFNEDSLGLMEFEDYAEENS